MNNSSNSSITSLVPGGVVTTQNISTVIRPKENNNSMQFVKIQTPELSKKAVEQIRVAQESKISKDKIKEVEEEWQNNLLSWKSKRRQQIGHVPDEDEQNNNPNYDANSGRKIKTFAEMIEQRARAGNRLNFHLERYIGSGDDEVGENIDQGPTSPQINFDEQNSKDVLDHHHDLASKIRMDSDCEAHSSMSSSYNQPDSKSPSSSLESPPDLQQHLYTGGVHSVSSLKPTEINKSYDSETTRSMQRDSSHSISLVACSETDQLNSTLKQGINEPPVHLNINNGVNNRPKPILDVDTRTNEVVSRLEDESDNSTFEDEDDVEQEEEEEQKQLQRIAFVAKLKAFEKMTKPTMQEPKFVPMKIPKAPPPTPPLPSRQIPKLDLRKKIPFPNSFDGSSNNIEPTKNELPKLILEPIQPSQPPSPPANRKHKVTQVPRAAHIEPAPPSPPQHLSSRSEPPVQLVHMDLRLQHSPSQLSRPAAQVSPREFSPQQLNYHHDNKQRQEESLRRKFESQHIRDPTPPQINHLSSQPPSLPPNNLNSNRNINSQVSPPMPDLSKPQIPGSNRTPRKPPPSTTSREDKDRTVLSISGKKRCSSCKEELGRGAAAFVVESLNLVYHTVCFRCSVCHINLADGFRGVDVRVHEEALHCQNCYSKDGLNYSRV